MVTVSTLKELPFPFALEHVEDHGAAFTDLRSVDAYLEVHIPASLNLLFEFGPGMAGRARDCIPLSVPLVLVDLGEVDYVHAAASLRGKGFTILGMCKDAINEWAAMRRAPASTEVATGGDPLGGTVLDVADAGARVPEGALRIPVDNLWARVDEVPRDEPIVLAAGAGVRASLAVGILERHGISDVTFWRTH